MALTRQLLLVKLNDIRTHFIEKATCTSERREQEVRLCQRQQYRFNNNTNKRGRTHGHVRRQSECACSQPDNSPTTIRLPSPTEERDDRFVSGRVSRDNARQHDVAITMYQVIRRPARWI